MLRLVAFVCLGVILSAALGEAQRPVPVVSAAKPPAGQSRFPVSQTGHGSAADSYVSSQLKPGGSLSLSAPSRSSGSGLSSLSASGSTASLDGSGSTESDDEDSISDTPTHTGSSCDGTFRCIGSRVTRVVKSFSELDEADRRAPDQEDIRKVGFGPTSSSSGSSGSSSGSSGGSTGPLPASSASMSEIGKFFDVAKCEAIKRAISAQRTIDELKNSLAAFSKASKYYASPKAVLPAACRQSASSSGTDSDGSSDGSDGSSDSTSGSSLSGSSVQSIMGSSSPSVSSGTSIVGSSARKSASIRSSSRSARSSASR